MDFLSVNIALTEIIRFPVFLVLVSVNVFKFASDEYTDNGLCSAESFRSSAKEESSILLVSSNGIIIFVSKSIFIRNFLSAYRSINNVAYLLVLFLCFYVQSTF